MKKFAKICSLFVVATACLVGCQVRVQPRKQTVQPVIVPVQPAKPSCPHCPNCPRCPHCPR